MKAKASKSKEFFLWILLLNVPFYASPLNITLQNHFWQSYSNNTSVTFMIYLKMFLFSRSSMCRAGGIWQQQHLMRKGYGLLTEHGSSKDGKLHVFFQLHVIIIWQTCIRAVFGDAIITSMLYDSPWHISKIKFWHCHCSTCECNCPLLSRILSYVKNTHMHRCESGRCPSGLAHGSEMAV